MTARMRTAALLLRGGAIVIAILGILDPAITTRRMSRPEIAVLSAHKTAGGPETTADAELADRLAAALADAFTVVRGSYSNAAAAVVVGSDIPRSLLASQMPVVAVLPARNTSIRIERIDAPRTTTRDARTIVNADIHVTGAAGRTIDVTLRDGSLVLDRVSRAIGSDEERVTVPLMFAPGAAGTAVLRVSARFADGDDAARFNVGDAHLDHGNGASAADVAIDVRDTRYAVLFYDHRPSWQSTFVRRAIEDDSRFTVTSRVVTSRGISTDAGRPPAGLSDDDLLANFDAVVIGAPELIASSELRALERFMRQHGGTVVLLLDHAARGPFERLAGIDGWSRVQRGRLAIRPAAGSAIADLPAPQACDVEGAGCEASAADSTAMLASEVVWPVRLPAGAEPVAVGDDADPLVWESAVGAGRLVMSGILDAWRFRDRPAFAPFWRSLLAGSAPPAIEVDVPGAPLSPGAEADVLVTVRDAVLANKSPGKGVTTSISVTFETQAGRTPVKVWPDGGAGRFRGVIRAPDEPGSYRLSVNTGDARAAAVVPVIADVRRAQPDGSRRLAAWVASRGGRVFDAGQIDEVTAEIARLSAPEPRAVTWHPMRGAWWIVPFVLLLGFDWWVRRNLTSYGGASSLSKADGPTD